MQFPFAFKPLLLGAFIVILLVATNCKNPYSNNTREKYVIPDSLLHQLMFDTVHTSQLVNLVKLTGMVDFDQEHQVEVFPMVSGKVQNVKVQLGDYVKVGDSLATITSSEMAGYSTSLVIAETNVSVTKKQLDVSKDLFASGLASQLDTLNAQSNYTQAVSQLAYIKKVLAINGNNTNGSFVITAPLSGSIVQKHINNSMLIRSDNANSLFTISNLRHVWVYANVYESNISQIHLGDNVSITTIAYPNRIFTGKIDNLMNVLDPTNKVMKVRIVVPNEDYALKPLMFASVSVTDNNKKETLCISKRALIFDNSRYYVLIYKNRYDVTIRPVELHNIVGDKAYINSGVQIGEIIIASQALLIYETLNS